MKGDYRIISNLCSKGQHMKHSAAHKLSGNSNQNEEDRHAKQRKQL